MKEHEPKPMQTYIVTCLEHGYLGEVNTENEGMLLYYSHQVEEEFGCGDFMIESRLDLSAFTDPTTQ